MNYFIIPGLMGRRKTDLLTFKDKGRVIAAVERYFELPYAKLIQRNRIQSICHPRQILTYLLIKHTPMNKSEVSRMFKTDHATIVHTMKKINGLIEVDDRVRNQIIEITENI